jgi:hypothetical protein
MIVPIEAGPELARLTRCEYGQSPHNCASCRHPGRGVPAAVTEVFAQLLCGAQQLSDCKFWVRAALTWIACLTSQVSVIQDFFLCLRLGMKLE